VPVLFLQHFRGNVDNWDPALVDGVSRRHEVILFDNLGVAGSSGTSPATAEGMAIATAEFIRALGIAQVDVFGFSLGGFVAQALALAEPALVRRLVLASTGPKGAPGMERWAPDVVERLVTNDSPGAGDVLYVFNAPTESSQTAGGASLGRIFSRQEGRDAEVSLETRDIQYQAVLAWGVQDWPAVQQLTQLTQPTLVLQGDNDIMIPTKASYTLAGLIPNAELVIYPDASHGAIFQFADETASKVTQFLAR
jgi:pimeloyl-ACP methyl ester carboxylesterase